MAASIFGVGVDIAHVPRFRRTLTRFGSRFLKRAFHPKELAAFERIRLPARQEQFVASRWAIKEAMTKAAGMRLQFPDICFCRNSTATDPRGQVELYGGAHKLARARGIGRAHVSLSHDNGYAIAFVVLERTEDFSAGTQEQSVEFVLEQLGKQPLPMSQEQDEDEQVRFQDIPVRAVFEPTSYPDMAKQGGNGTGSTVWRWVERAGVEQLATMPPEAEGLDLSSKHLECGAVCWIL